ncbi:thiamine phosphate synthase [Thermococci archaeon]|nr:MAG: thiamine phosphate synthase [Thermococci archaeon]
MNLRKKLKLYVITDRRLKPEVESVREALEGGATSIQLRIKNAPTREMIEIGRKIRELTKEYDVLYFVDDRLDVALATNADGVQLGPEDMPISLAREIAPNLIIGASVYSLEEALKAEKEGADYLGAGSVFPTPTKRDAKVIGLEGLKRIVDSVKIPVVAIGGINHENVREVLKTGVDGIAVISAIMGADDVKIATEEMRKIIEEVIG